MGKLGGDFAELTQTPPEETVVVLGCPKEDFTAAEFEMLRKFIREGGSLIVLLAEGGEARANTNINFLLEEYGMSVNADAVVRASFHKYMHPRECHITGGVLNRAVTEATQQRQGDDDAVRTPVGVSAECWCRACVCASCRHGVRAPTVLVCASAGWVHMPAPVLRCACVQVPVVSVTSTG